PIYIASDSSVYKQYISIPVLWRNYYTLLGYFRNKFTGELWLEPIILPEMNHTIQNGFFLSPEGWGTINVSQQENKEQIIFKTDKPIKVTYLYLRDKSVSPSDSVKVLINGIEKPIVRIGEEYSREIKIDYSDIIDSSGIIIDIIYGSEGIKKGAMSSISRLSKYSLFTNVSGRFVLPEFWHKKKVWISLYSVKGELLGRRSFKKTYIDLKKDFKISKGLVIIEVELNQ
ncbi:MAG: hypothetical protein N2053_10395, partial [Chitinispirillaceae bacterium]|nr:hypothetical protein [Chitinispirillaceae bacterium]